MGEVNLQKLASTAWAFAVADQADCAKRSKDALLVGRRWHSEATKRIKVQTAATLTHLRGPADPHTGRAGALITAPADI